MKSGINLGLLLVISLFTACRNQSKLINDRLVLKDGSELTGRIQSSDSTTLRLEQKDESIRVINFKELDTIYSNKFCTRISSAGLGIFNTAYYSVFENQNHAPTNLGLQLRTGKAFNQNRYHYLNLELIPSKPFNIRKLGAGFEYYKRGGYMSPKNLTLGFELNLLGVRYNNVPQLTLEPHFGKQWYYKGQMRIYCNAGLQFNLAGRNQNAGVFITGGINYLHIDFGKKYQPLNQKIANASK